MSSKKDIKKPRKKHTGPRIDPDTADEMKAKMIEWLNDSTHGTFSEACAVVGISRTTGYDWKKLDIAFSEEIDAALRQACNTGLDLAEKMLIKKIANGDTTTLLAYLRTKGRFRGFVEKTEQQISGDPMNPVKTDNTIRIIHVDAHAPLPKGKQ